MDMRGAIRIGFVASALAVALCTSHAQTLRIGLADDPDMLDPTLGRTFSGRLVFAALCDKLFDIDEQLNVVPQLATRYEWSADNKASASGVVPNDRMETHSAQSHERH